MGLFGGERVARKPIMTFPTGIVDQVAHRPWPLPSTPWIMTQSWHDLLFAHWPVSVDLLRSRIPAGIEVELFEGQAWLGIVPFHMTNVAPRFVPALPFVSAFPEMNVRTYVRVGDKPGIYFFSLDAANPLAVGVARTMFHLPYFNATMEVREEHLEIHYRSQRVDAPPAEFAATYRPTGPAHHAVPGTLEYFLTERYCLYTLDQDFHLYRLDIHHLPWPLQQATATIETNTMADAAGLRLPSMAPLLHFSKRQDMLAWPLQRI
jgi:uncharacterized protein